MVASCYRRCLDYPRAFRRYKKILEADPGNDECISYLKALSKDP
jgi:hypothetical protein